MIDRNKRWTFFIHREFSVGFIIYSPTLNGLCWGVNLMWFGMRYWSKGDRGVTFGNYWNG